jgi:hypothetical protein
LTTGGPLIATLKIFAVMLVAVPMLAALPVVVGPVAPVVPVAPVEPEAPVVPLHAVKVRQPSDTSASARAVRERSFLIKLTDGIEIISLEARQLCLAPRVVIVP